MACLRMQHKTYAWARLRMRPGDLLAFADYSRTSRVIRWASTKVTGRKRPSVPSHVGSYFCAWPEGGGGPMIQTVEALRSGIEVKRLSLRLKEYADSPGGIVWWLPLQDVIRERMDTAAFNDSLLHQQGLPYDWWQAMCSAEGLWVTRWLPHNQRDYRSTFCAESYAVALQAAGGLPANINCSRLTPADLSSLALWGTPDYYQIVGKRTCTITSINTIPWPFLEFAEELRE